MFIVIIIIIIIIIIIKYKNYDQWNNTRAYCSGKWLSGGQQTSHNF
jgi:hypothetical protein